MFKKNVKGMQQNINREFWLEKWRNRVENWKQKTVLEKYWNKSKKVKNLDNLDFLPGVLLI